jgi:transposase
VLEVGDPCPDTAADHAHYDRHRWLWELLEPLLPTPQRRSRYPGRKRLDDRAVLNDILNVLRSESPGRTYPATRLRLRDDLLAAPA